MENNRCCICDAKFHFANPPKQLVESNQEMRMCADCADILSAIRFNHGKTEPHVVRLYDEAVSKLSKSIRRNGVRNEVFELIDVNLGFALLASKRRTSEDPAEERRALASMLITSGFNFEGYRITKYSGYISGDDVVQVDRGLDFLISRGTDTGSALSDALVKIRRNALRELKKAAYDLGCNAVIGVDFDYITLDPQTANIMGGTTYMPYVFCVTANGNAVVIEKIED